MGVLDQRVASECKLTLEFPSGDLDTDQFIDGRW